MWNDDDFARVFQFLDDAEATFQGQQQRRGDAADVLIDECRAAKESLAKIAESLGGN
jgi:hypothetical protein